MRLSTDAKGQYTVGADQGEYELSIDTTTLEPFYSAVSNTTRQIRMAAAAPARVDFVVRANARVSPSGYRYKPEPMPR